MYRKSILNNGLRVVSHTMRERDGVSLGILVGAGGRSEPDQMKGAAHFLEHLLFKGSRKYSCQQIKENVEGVGGSLNAFTAEEQTCFYAKVPRRHFSKTFDVFADMIMGPAMKPADIRRERGVILEEIKMYYDLPQYLVFELMEKILWPGHPLGKGLAGTLESVAGLNGRKLRDFHRSHYVPNNMVVAVCGDIDHHSAVSLVRKKMGGMTFAPSPEWQPVIDDQKQPRVAVCRKPIEQTHIALGMPGLPADDPARYALRLLNIVLGGNMSSRLFNELRERRGLAYSIGSGCKHLSDTGLFMIRAGLKTGKVQDALRLIMSELKKVSRSGITQAEFTRAKEYYIGQVLLGMEDSMEHMLWIGESTIVRDHIRTLDEVIRAIKQVRINDVKKAAAAVFDPSRYNLAVVGPLPDRQAQDLRAMFQGSVESVPEVAESVF